MTKEQTKEAIKVMQAFVDGREIEVFDDDTYRWVPCGSPIWSFTEYNYRVKPEPKYRPYANAKEMDAAVKKHGSFVKYKESNRRAAITWWNDDELGIDYKDIVYNYADLLHLFTWLDGSLAV